MEKEAPTHEVAHLACVRLDHIRDHGSVHHRSIGGGEPGNASGRQDQDDENRLQQARKGEELQDEIEDDREEEPDRREKREIVERPARPPAKNGGPELPVIEEDEKAGDGEREHERMHRRHRQVAEPLEESLREA